MIDLVEKILISSNEYVEYWSFLFEHDSILGNIHDYFPELVRISLVESTKQYLIDNFSSLKPYSINASHFNIRSVKSRNVVHTHTDSIGQIFLYPDYESCVEAYNKRVYQCLSYAKNEKEKLIKAIDQRIDRLERSFIDSDIIIETLKHSS